MIHERITNRFALALRHRCAEVYAPRPIRIQTAPRRHFHRQPMAKKPVPGAAERLLCPVQYPVATTCPNPPLPSIPITEHAVAF